MPESSKVVWIDGSRLMIEAAVQAGADVFIGYPITPANLLFQYASRRFPAALPAPDEITTLQWMSGFSAAGRLPVTATSFPGLALMVESINMAYMMELPMVILLPQRLGPSTGTATAGAQGDLALIHGMISGGHPLLTLCPSNIEDGWRLSAHAVERAATLRTPVVVLTSKEMVMTRQRLDLSVLPSITPVRRCVYEGEAPYLPYAAETHAAPPFLPVGQARHQVRLNASTHDRAGLIQHTSPEALDNTRRLHEKIAAQAEKDALYSYDADEAAETLVVAFGITALSAREAVAALRARGKNVSLLIPQTLFPIPRAVLERTAQYPRVVVAEENLDGQYRRLLFGAAGRKGVVGVNGIGRLISPDAILRCVESP